MRSDCAWEDDRNLYLNATASGEGCSATVKSSPTHGEEKGPAPSNVTTGDGLTESPSVLVTEHLGCSPTTVAVLGREVIVAILRDLEGGLSEDKAARGESAGWDIASGQPLTAELGARGGLPRYCRLTARGIVGFGI